MLLAAARTDASDQEGFAALFTPDAVLMRPNGSALQGHEAIVASYRERPANRITRHLVCGTLFTACDASTAEATTQVVLWSGDMNDAAGPFGRPAQRQFMGTLQNHFVHIPEGWRVQHRVASFTLMAE